MNSKPVILFGAAIGHVDGVTNYTCESDSPLVVLSFVNDLDHEGSALTAWKREAGTNVGEQVDNPEDVFAFLGKAVEDFRAQNG